MIKFFKGMINRFKHLLNPQQVHLNCLQKESGLSLLAIKQQVERKILLANNLSDGLTSDYQFLGGSNNLGFFRHFVAPQEWCLWVTKFASSDMLERENIFLQWHKTEIEPVKQFAPKWITSGQLADSDIEFMVTENLTPIKKPNFQQVAELYQCCEGGGKLFKSLNALPALKSGSRIRDVLIQLVCQFDSPQALLFLVDYFAERKTILSMFSKEMDLIQSTLSKAFSTIGTIDNESLGFVHGDFKASNMMADSEGRLKLIDFQYYCYGVRVWDLAFYLSKQKTNFEQSVPVVIKLLNLQTQEKMLLAFTYIIAVLLHPKPKRFAQQFQNQILPALTYLNRGLGMKQGVKIRNISV